MCKNAKNGAFGVFLGQKIAKIALFCTKIRKKRRISAGLPVFFGCKKRVSPAVRGVFWFFWV